MADTLGELLERVKAGDRCAVESLVSQFSGPAGRLAVALVGDAHLAEDVLQEAFVGALLRLGELRSPEAFPSWFRQIVRTYANRCVRGHVAPRGHRPVVRSEKAASVMETLEHEEVCRLVREALQRLPVAARQAAEMFYFQERSVAEVAALLHVPEGTVKRRLYDARIGLRRLLGPAMSPERNPFAD